MKPKLRTLSTCMILLQSILALSGCVVQPVEPVATTRIFQQQTPVESAPGRQAPKLDTPIVTVAISPSSQQGAPAGTVESEPIATTESIPVEVEEPAVESGQVKSNLSGWVEMEDPHSGFRFAVPCFWYVDFPERYGAGQAYYLRNYRLEYAMSFPPDIDDLWERGGIKIDMVMIRRLHPSISMCDYVTGSRSEADDYRIVSIEELVINNQDALFVTTESSTFGTGQYYILTVSDEAFLIFSPSPGSHQNPDVQAILYSITFDPDIDFPLPDYPPGTLIEGVITECKGANRLKALLAGPKSLTWGSGEPVKVYFALVNLTDQELFILNWLTPFEGNAGDMFRVERDGQPVSYYGILASRGDPTPDSYIMIEPKGAITTEVNLSGVYDFSRPGRYMIAFKSPHTSSIIQAADDFAKSLEELGLVIIPSNEITLEIVLEN